MIPTFDIEIEREYELGVLHDDLTAADVAGGFTDHQEYRCLGLLSWGDARGCLQEEAELLGSAAASTAPDGIEEFLDKLHEEDDVGYADLWHWTFHGNDPGAAGLSAALNAARVATFYSCSSGVDKRHHARYPMVGAAPDAERAKLIAELAEQAECGIDQYYAWWYIYARSVSDLHALGNLLVENRQRFDALPEPGWVEGLQQELDRLED